MALSNPYSYLRKYLCVLLFFMRWVMQLLTSDRSNNYVKDEADNHLKLLQPSILDIYKVTEHIDMLPIGIW